MLITLSCNAILSRLTTWGTTGTMAAAYPSRSDDLERQYDERYARFGRLLEATHAGAYLAIAPDGRTVLGDSLLDVAQQAKRAFGPGSFLYKVGEPSVGQVR